MAVPIGQQARRAWNPYSSGQQGQVPTCLCLISHASVKKSSLYQGSRSLRLLGVAVQPQAPGHNKMGLYICSALDVSPNTPCLWLLDPGVPITTHTWHEIWCSLVK